MNEILAERKRQVGELGWKPEHDDEEGGPDHLLGLVEEYVGKARVEEGPDPDSLRAVRKRLVQVGALAVAGVEACDRQLEVPR